MVSVLEQVGWLPQPPDWRVDWPGIQAACPWLAALAGTPQDPSYHGEGDVLTHTGMVAAALAGLPAWQALAPAERAGLFLAALLHDIGKPACTRSEGGIISSRGHARAGAALTRRLLWSEAGPGAPLPLAEREAIAGLVRHHGLPIWFLDRPELDRALIGASMQARLGHTALLAEADALGRIAAGQAELLARIELFRTRCSELGCLDGPFAFASAHSRVRYFHSAQPSPHYHAHDDTWGEVVLLAGLPGVGKDTWARTRLPNLPQIALDAIRAELGAAPSGDQGAVVAAARERARALLRRRQPFVWNATNLTRRMRAPLIELMLGYGARVRIVYLDAPLGEVLRRNQQRPAPVPTAVIRRLAAAAEPPDLSEAHVVEWVEVGDEPRR